MLGTGTDNGTKNGTDGQNPSALEAPKFVVKRPGELTLPERRRWTKLRASNPALYSPYFDIVYCDHVSAIRPDSYVVIALRGDKPAAFLPYQSAGKFAAPIGAPMTDYHGVIKHPSEPLDAARLLQAAGLSVFSFNSLIDVPSERDGSYRRSLKSLRRRIRKTEAEHGERHFVFRCKDKDVFDQLMAWKHLQFKTTGKY